MKLTIFGATGGTGRQLVRQALEAGNDVVVYARNPGKLDIKHEHMKIVKGELSDQMMIENAISGADAVISVLGPRGGSKSKPLTQGIQNIIAAMKRYGVTRLIVSSTLSVKDPNDFTDLKARLLVDFVKLTLPSAYEEILSVADIVSKSDLDWTILRLTMLNNKPRSGKVRVGYLGRGEVGLQISRTDLAEFMLNQVNDDNLIRQSPVISN